MKIFNYHSSTNGDKVVLKDKTIWDAPYYKKYSAVYVGSGMDDDIFSDYIKNGFVFRPTDNDFLCEANIDSLYRISEKDIYEIRNTPNKSFKLWRPIEKEEVECVFSIQQTIIVQGKEYRRAWIEDGKGLACSVSELSPQFGKPFEVQEYLEHYGRVDRVYYYSLNPELIDSILFKKTYYNLDLFGEKKYLDESHSEEFTLEMRNPDMAVYEYIRSHGLLEIDWEK